MAIFEAPLSWSEAIRLKMWKLMDNVQSSLFKVEELRDSILLQVFEYSQSGGVESGALNCS